MAARKKRKINKNLSKVLKSLPINIVKKKKSKKKSNKKSKKRFNFEEKYPSLGSSNPPKSDTDKKFLKFFGF